MGTSPPNWQWCQDATEEDRRSHLLSTGKKRGKSKDGPLDMVEVVDFYYNPPARKSDYAVCVIPANELAMELLDITRDSIKSYAEECGADYIELSGDQHPDWPMANKYRLHNVSSSYKKTLYLDCDVLVLPNSPNIFELTPDDKISAYDEYPSWKDKGNEDWIQRQQEVVLHKHCDKETRERLFDNGKFVAYHMINGGVMVIPQSCADYYQQPKEKYPSYWCFDQSLLTLTLPPEKFNSLEKEWNLEYVLDDIFWYYLPDAHFVHVNSLRKEPEFRKFLLQNISYGDLAKSHMPTFNWYDKTVPKIVEEITKPHKESVVTDRFQSNRIGIVFNHLSPGGSTVWLEDFTKCFKEEIAGIFSLKDSTECRDVTMGLDGGVGPDELYELYVKSDVMIYWICDPNTIDQNDNMDYFPDFIWKNPLGKKIVFLSHGSLRVNTSGLLIDMLSPDVSVFVDPFAAYHHKGVCIPPVVSQMDNLVRNPLPKNILWHHRLECNKGVEILLGIVQALPDFIFHIAGSWVREEHLSAPETVEHVESILSQENVFYYGHLDDMKPLFERCSLSLSTSYDESFGLSVAESIVNGIPSVSHSAGVGCRSDRVIRYCAHPTEWAKEIRLCEATTDVAKNRDYLLSRFSMERFEKAWRRVIC
jgi:glycosyltransferase involved in cell wall biosynthesis